MTFRADGNVHQELQDGSLFTVPASGLNGHGTIAGRPVRCLTPAIQLAAHLGYTPDATDHHDMALLQARFNLDLPESYRT
jgi:lincosamide nucleotidyltransferase A/C/D/E